MAGGDAVAVERVLGDFGAGRDGPLLVLVGGVHGNEPGGVEALRDFCLELATRAELLRGRVLALAGNLAGLAARRRFVDEDLNRAWTRENVERLTGGGVAQSSEERELIELEGLLAEALAGAHTGVTLLDLHSTSGEGPPFAILSDHGPARELARALEVTAVLGLHKNVRGTLIDWFEELGHTSVVLEAGQNDAPVTRARHRAAAWLALECLGLLEPGALDLSAERATMLEATAHLPATVEVCLRWGIEPGERFRMEPDFVNLQPVHRGQLLAHGGAHAATPIHAPFDGLLLMPLYQEQGSDGFFLGLVPQAFANVRPRRA
ncbi:MAG TPA: succinylglutamate desuccinylase/aspartoacylase family protein [Planctomycetota bacterium]|nr:succinylglutamate desuccinylase/aspartoacylase family protein [Planctomycetota bacterium]